ncbi:MAG: hypothetical protein NVS3B24_22080 [Candidatus Dormibacteria bacterium]
MIVVLVGYLFLAAATGFMLTFVSRMPWQLEGRLAAGVALGFAAAAMLTWLAAIPIGMSGVSVALGALLLASCLAACVRFAAWREPLALEWGALRARWRTRSVLPLVLLVTIALVFFVPFYMHALELKPDGLYAGYPTIWGDWCTHLAIAGYLSHAQHVLPPDNPFFSGVKLTYPFLPDLFAGILLHLGMGLEGALPLASAVMSLALVLVFFATAQRLGGDHWAAAIAVVLFFLGGGLGFLNILKDVHPTQAGIFPALGALVNAVIHPLREYTLDRATGFQWLNPILAYLVPQRATLYGFSLGLIVVSLAWYARGTGRRRDFLLGGLLLGLMPLQHANSYFDLALFFTGVAVVDAGAAVARGAGRARVGQWATFLVPAAVIGLPQVLLILPPAAYDHSFLRLQLGWLSTTPDYQLNVVLFWLLNTALLIPLAIGAFFLNRAGKPGLLRFLAPAWLLFLLPNLVILQPWDWDNTKWFVWWAILASILGGLVIAQLGRRGPLFAGVALVFLVASTASGAIDVGRASQPRLPNVSYRLLSTDEINVAAWARGNTPGSAVFLTGWQNNHPILTMSRREVVMGYPGWIWTWGLPDNHRQADVVAMFHGGPGTEALLRKYRVAYVVIGPEELDGRYGPGANLGWWESTHRVIFRSRDYQVFSAA